MSICSSVDVHFVQRASAGRGRPAPASTAASKEELLRSETHLPERLTSHTSQQHNTVGRSIHRNDERTAHRRRIASIAQSPPRRLSRILSRDDTSVCVCIRYDDGINDDGDRVGSVLLLLPCHTVTRNDQVARVREWRFSAAAAVPKPGKITTQQCVCECVTDYYRARKVCRTRRFSVFPCRV